MKYGFSFAVFLCIAAGCFAYPSGMESQTVQNWETAQVDSKITIDLHKSGLYLPTDRNAAIRLIQQNRSSLLKNAYLSVLVDSSHRVGSYRDQQREKHCANTFSGAAKRDHLSSKSFTGYCKALCKTQCAVCAVIFSLRYGQ